MKTLYDIIWEKHGKKPKPILLNTEMVRAILNGRKTQTRRPMEKQMKAKGNWGYSAFNPSGYISFRNKGEEKFLKLLYQPSDILYVRETWKVLDISVELLSLWIKYQVDGKCKRIKFKYDRLHKFRKYYDKEGWKPSIFMPKEAARIFLKVTGISVERLQDITTENAISEGAREEKNHLTDPETKEERLYIHYHDYSGRNNYCTARVSYKYLWNNLYASKGYSWNDNPWVWVIEFERCDKPC